ncbi:MAG TPA: Uma2 family endonuclease [Kofleriaceae bacterium]|nr:Uma2 family endonuclease [Kofleriaceae bacterium]
MMSFKTEPDADPDPDLDLELPAVDARLVAPETRHEIEDGRVVYVPPADEPHATYHLKLGDLFDAHRATGYAVATDMLTRTSKVDDIAPDISVYPAARDPRTGGRQLEELAFEVASTESLSHAGKRAAKLVARGVRRVFALDVERRRALEWSPEAGRWTVLDPGGRLEDRALAVPMPIAALLDTALADDAIVRAWRAKRHPEFMAERAEGRAEGLVKGVLAVLAGRGLEPTAAERRRLLEEREPGRLERWLAAAGTCADIAALLAVP